MVPSFGNPGRLWSLWDMPAKSLLSDFPSRSRTLQSLRTEAAYLYQKPDRGCFGAEEGLHTRATLPTDRCHLNDAAVRINRDHRDDTAIGEEDMVERTISVHENLRALAANMLKLRHELLQIARWQGK